MSLLEKTVNKIVPQSEKHRAEMRQKIERLTMPHWALGRLLDLALDIAGIRRSCDIALPRRRVVLMAGDHGIVADGVTSNPQEVTGQMVRNFINGGAGINAIAELSGAQVMVVDMGVACDLADLVNAGKVIDCKVAPGTASFLKGPAMSRAQAFESLEKGIKVALEFGDDTDVFCTGEMGIGNTSPSSAIITVLSGASDPMPFVGGGASLPPGGLKRKSAIIRQGIEANSPDPADGIDLLSKIGGFEIGGIAGLILGAASRQKVVVVDGFISSAGALIAALLAPNSRDYMILGHGSAEPGHRAMAQILGKKPLLDLDMRLGEGTGAALALPLLDAAAAVVSQMATYDEAGVTQI